MENRCVQLYGRIASKGTVYSFVITGEGKGEPLVIRKQQLKTLLSLFSVLQSHCRGNTLCEVTGRCIAKRTLA